MEILRAPWRNQYVTSAAQAQGCVMCRALARESEPDLVVHESPSCFAMTNLFPYSSGHVMVAPLRHEGELEALTPEEATALMHLTQRATATVKRAYAPEGLNVGVNLGAAAGAGVPGHLHVHVVPRWNADTNFMTAIAETRVLPESLSVTLERLRDAWERA